MKSLHCLIFGLALLMATPLQAAPTATATRMFEADFETSRTYSDPFNDVELDVVFSGNGGTWRVPAFWRGGSRWTVRFAPPAAGRFSYRLESTDRSNPDFNRQGGTIEIQAYSGPNHLLRHGPPRVSASRRYFEHADGTPFYWLGDAAWTRLSDRISWEGFKTLAADRKAKGFTVFQMAGGLVPSNEELAPSDPGFCNEGGCVWEPGFKAINPHYFDFADRRIQHLVDIGITPALVGAWHQVMAEMGTAKLKKHWRYLIARYGVYPIFWVLGGEVYDPLPGTEPKRQFDPYVVSTGWRELAAYVRATDPYRHPITVHEQAPPYDAGLGDPTLTDFDFMQPAHFGWPSIATTVAMLNSRLTRPGVTKPLVIGELNWEGIGGQSFQDAQRAGFWLSMLNGAAGFSYGTFETAEAYGTDKPIHRTIGSSLSWKEGMIRLGSYQVGIGSNLLREHRWWLLAPRPDWITPHGTNLLDPRKDGAKPVIDLIDAAFTDPRPRPDQLPAGEWQERGAKLLLPYMAGIPSELRIAYIPYFGLMGDYPRPSILALEPGVIYHASFWQPDTGVTIDVGRIGASRPGPVLAADRFDRRRANWRIVKGVAERKSGRLEASSDFLGLIDLMDQDYRASVHVTGDAGIALRYRDPDNYLAANYSAQRSIIEIVERKDGISRTLTALPAPNMSKDVELRAEVRGGIAAAIVADGKRSYSTPVVDVMGRSAGRAGIMVAEGRAARLDDFELRRSVEPPKDGRLEKRMRDAKGTFRGMFDAPPTPTQLQMGWPSYRDYGLAKDVLLETYRPPRRPWAQDWVLVMKRVNTSE